MIWNKGGRLALACAVSAVALGMSACGAGTNGYLWVFGAKTQSNGTGDTITGFKIDNNTGNLTEIVGSPFQAGTNPVAGVVRPGGRNLYVVNSGDSSFNGSGIRLYSVGGDGVLTVQQVYTSQGGTPVWIDLNQSTLFVLDKVSPDPTVCQSPTGNPNNLPCGAVSVFTIDDTTGRLTLVQNTSVKTSTGAFLTYFPVGPAPTRMKVVGSNLIVVNGDRTVSSFNIRQNQLTTSANTRQILDQTTPGVNPTVITSITSGGSYLYLTDGANNRILEYTVASDGTLQPVTGGVIDNSPLAPGQVPVWTISSSGAASAQKLYVLNQGGTNTNQPTSSITGYVISTNGSAQPISGSNTYPVGGGPTCAVIDPSNQYLYTSNLDGTVTGTQIDQSQGPLRPLRRGATFSITGRGTCLAVSGTTS